MRIRRQTPLWPIAVSCLFLATCQYAEDRFLRRNVQPNEIPGVWQLTPFGLKSLRDVGHTAHLTITEHTLTFAADGSCTFQSVTDPTLQGPKRLQAYMSTPAPCRWVLAGAAPRQRIDLSVSVTAENPSFAPSYYFDEQGARLLMWTYATDPDAWRYVEFVRVR